MIRARGTEREKESCLFEYVPVHDNKLTVMCEWDDEKLRSAEEKNTHTHMYVLLDTNATKIV